jgi:hypothetical protein
MLFGSMLYGANIVTFAATASDFYDDGLVHAHEWSRATPPGVHHLEDRQLSPSTRLDGKNDELSACQGPQRERLGS